MVGVIFALWTIHIAWPISHQSLRDWWNFFTAEVVGLACLAYGLYAWWRRWPPASNGRVGQLMVIVGSTYYIGNLQASANSVLCGLGFWLYYLTFIILGHIVLSFPTGRPRRGVDRCVIATLYLGYLIVHGMRYLRSGRCACALKKLTWHEAGLQGIPYTIWSHVASAFGLVGTVVVLILVVQRWRSVSRLDRQAYTALWVFVGLFGLLTITHFTAALLSIPSTGRLRLFHFLLWGFRSLAASLLLSGPWWWKWWWKKWRGFRPARDNARGAS
ncbi:MAG: hypothetical protein ACRDYA_06915 [Egibacteraceae bacterium]